MATDATGTPTSLGIPKFNTAVDSPSGLGGNAQMDAIDALIVADRVSLAAKVDEPASIASGEVPVWNGSAWVRSSVTNIGPSSLGSGTPAAGKYLAGDGTWTTLPSTSAPTPATTLPGSPTNGQQAILTDSTTAPTYSWLFQYDTTISGSYKWRFLGSGAYRVNGLSLTVPRAGNYHVEIGGTGRLYNSVEYQRVQITAGGVTLSAQAGANGGGTETIAGSTYDSGVMNALTASQVLTLSDNGAIATASPYVKITPILVA